MADAVRDHLRVLHVDGDPDFGDLTADSLERRDDRLSVVTETSAADGLDRLAAETFDCVVSDYDLADTDGLSFLEAVREDYPNLPFVLFTGRGSEDVASAAISAGVTDYLRKGAAPDRFAVLANRVREAVESSGTEWARRESEHRYRTVVEQSRDAIYIFQDGVLEFVNGRACRLTGYDRDELEGMDFRDVVHPDDHERVERIAARRERHGDAPETYEVRLRTKSGVVRQCELSVRPITYEGRYATLGFVRDVTDRRQNERTFEALHTATREMMHAETKERVCEIAVETARSELGFPLTGCWLADEDETLRPAAQTAMSHETFDGQPTFEPGDSLAWRTFQRGETAVYEDVRTEADVHDPETPVRSEVIVPLGDQGVLTTGTTEIRDFDDADVEFLELLGTNTETALDRAEREAEYRRLGAELHENKRKIEELHEIATQMEACETEQAVYDLTVDAAERILEFDICVVDAEEDGLLKTKSMSTGIVPDETPTMSVDEGVVGRTYRTGEANLADDLRDVDAADPQGDYRSGISVPVGDWGVFQAVAEEVGFFDETDLELAELLVTHAAEALNRVERERLLREREERLRRQKDQLEDFAGIVSHDLRNPLNVAHGYVDLLAETYDDGRLTKTLNALDRMEAIIDDVLTLAREGELVDDPEPVALATVVRGAWANVDTADATLASVPDGRIEADGGRLQQLFENLFRNAVEHAGRDVTVRVGALRDGPADGFVDGVYVEDDGPGVPESERTVVFDSDYSTRDDGTGFGLAIVDQIADAHGWTASVTEGVDGGARFEIRETTGDPGPSADG
ncbi:GAF domain-containing protein [Halomicrococcus sp. SG-WS-1]|uniref:PAS domain-containing sensor histidine kinase n=1 Tax=Halomicrococcus sp. SG-WS-1 TaxID=3439057 RepID=UPI003F7AF367